MSSSRCADVKYPAPKAVNWKDEHGAPREPRSERELQEFAQAARAEGEAERAVDLQSWEDALGLRRSGPGAKSPGKSPYDAKVGDAAARLTLPERYIVRITKLRQEFAQAGDGSTVGERLLEDLVAMDAGVALALIDEEARTVALLQKAGPTDPAPALKMTELAEKIGGLSAAVRARMQTSLAAAAGLRARRQALKRGANGK
jgi:hypothetical protein